MSDIVVVLIIGIVLVFFMILVYRVIRDANRIASRNEDAATNDPLDHLMSMGGTMANSELWPRDLNEISDILYRKMASEHKEAERTKKRVNQFWKMGRGGDGEDRTKQKSIFTNLDRRRLREVEQGK